MGPRSQGSRGPHRGRSAEIWRKTDARRAAGRMVLGAEVADHAAATRTVLIVDDNARFRVRARRGLEAEGYEG